MACIHTNPKSYADVACGSEAPERAEDESVTHVYKRRVAELESAPDRVGISPERVTKPASWEELHARWLIKQLQESERRKAALLEVESTLSLG